MGPMGTHGDPMGTPWGPHGSPWGRQAASKPAVSHTPTPVAGAGTFVYCGRIINFGVTANATLYSNETQTCGDVSNCNFDSTVNCLQYTVSTYASSGQQYSYTDCNGVFRSEGIGGAGGYDADTFCALVGSVDPGSNNLSVDGDCEF